MSVSEAKMTEASQLITEPGKKPQEVKAGARKSYPVSPLEKNVQSPDEEQKVQAEMAEWTTKFYALGVLSIALVVLSHP